MALVTDKDVGQALANLFREEMFEGLHRQSLLLAKLHYGPCEGDPCAACEAAKPKPPSRWTRARRWTLRTFWWRPWAFVHRVLPGECPW